MKRTKTDPAYVPSAAYRLQFNRSFTFEQAAEVVPYLARSWTGEMSWPATNQPLLEYACHEGNYALGDVLRGARHQEAEEATSKQ